MNYIGGSAVEKPMPGWACGVCGAGPFAAHEFAVRHCATSIQCSKCGTTVDIKDWPRWSSCATCAKNDRDEADAAATKAWFERPVVDYRECKHGFFYRGKYIRNQSDLGEELYWAIEEGLAPDEVRVCDAVPLGAPEGWSFSEFVATHLLEEFPEELCDVDDCHDDKVREILANIWPECFTEGDKRVDVAALWSEIEGESRKDSE